jgi:hypothetical protein
MDETLPRMLSISRIGEVLSKTVVKIAKLRWKTLSEQEEIVDAYLKAMDPDEQMNVEDQDAEMDD